MRFSFSKYCTCTLPFCGILCAMLAMTGPIQAQMSKIENRLRDQSQTCISKKTDAVFYVGISEGLAIEDALEELTKEEKERVFIGSFGKPKCISRDTGLSGTMNYIALSTLEERREAGAMFWSRYHNFAEREYWTSDSQFWKETPDAN